MITAFKRIFCRTTPTEIARCELIESELHELTYQAAQEYAAAMVAYHQAKSRRLQTFINKEKIAT